MEIKTLPKSIHDITLEQWVNWNILYGKELIAKAKTDKNPDEWLLFETDFYSKHYAFYSDTPLSDIDAAIKSEDGSIVEVIKEASLSQAMMFREMADLQNVDMLNTDFKFAGFTWRIKPPFNVTDTNELTIEDFEHSQDVALIFSDLQDGKIEAMYELCLEYLQTGDNIHPTIDMLKTLPLYIALCVRRYVEDTIKLYSAFKQ